MELTHTASSFLGATSRQVSRGLTHPVASGQKIKSPQRHLPASLERGMCSLNSQRAIAPPRGGASCPSCPSW